MRMAKLAHIFEGGKEKFPKLQTLEKRGLAVGAYLRMIDGAYDSLAGVEDHWGFELEGSHRFRWIHSYWCASAVIYHLYRFFGLFTTMRKQESLKTPAKCNLA